MVNKHRKKCASKMFDTDTIQQTKGRKENKHLLVRNASNNKSK